MSTLDPPARPYLTPLFAAGLALWAACAAVFSAAQTASDQACFAIGATCAVGAFAALAAALKWRGARLPLIVVLALLAGASLAGFEAWSLHAAAEGFALAPVNEADVVLLSDTKLQGSNEQALAETRIAGATVLATVSFDPTKPHLRGERFHVVGSFSSADYASSSYAWQRASIGTFRVREYERLEAPAVIGPLLAVRRKALELMGAFGQSQGLDPGLEHEKAQSLETAQEQHETPAAATADRAILEALVCGYRHDIDALPEYSAFKACGLAHLIAVSGAHLVIVTGLFLALLQTLRAPRTVTIGAALAIMLMYLVISGVPISAVRAVFMSSVGLFAFFGKRRPSSLNALGLCLLFIVGTSPHEALSLSLALSTLSTAGIVVFAPLFNHWLSMTPIARLPFVNQALSLTLSSSVLSQLYATATFGVLPLVSPIANVATAPLFPLACGLGIVAVLLVCAVPAMGPAVLALADAPVHVLAAVVKLLADLPFSCLPLSIGTVQALAVSCCAAGALWSAWTTVRVSHVLVASLAFAAFGLVLALAFPPGDAIVMLDVGQGDAFLLRSKGHTVLVDTGNQDTRLVTELAQTRTLALDAVVVTHADDDHCGSLDALENVVRVRQVIVASGIQACADESCVALCDQAARLGEIIEVTAGDTLTIGSFTCEVMWPVHLEHDGGNEDSICLHVGYDENGDGTSDITALFTGDAEKEQLAEILASHDVGPVDILKVGHHGSRNGMTTEQAHQLDPRIALIGVGAHNRYGHPTDEILDMLADTGSSVYRSDLNGTVTCALDSQGITVTADTLSG